MASDRSGERGSTSPVAWEHSLLLIPAPSDRKVHESLRTIAWRFRTRVVREHLWIEGDVPMSAGLSAPRVGDALQKLIDADCAIISRIELDLAGMRITYWRSGGHSPFKESFFDEIRIELIDELTFCEDCARDVLRELCATMHVSTHSSTPRFKQIIDEIDASYMQPDGSSNDRGFGQTHSS